MLNLLFRIAVLSILLPPSIWAYIPGKTYRVTVLHTNDNHGAFWRNEKGEYGMAARATLIAKIRAEVRSQGGHVLLLDGGDVNTGTPESELADAQPDFLGMSLMGYDAMALGNHEFDKPFEVLLKQQREWANFPFLSANIFFKGTDKTYFDSHKDMLLDDLKVTLFGLTTEQTPVQSIRFPHELLELRPAVEVATVIVPKLRKKSDILIAVTHTGHYPDEKHGSRSPGDVTIARRAPGIDLIVGGHTQLPLFKVDTQGSTHIVQAGEWGKHLGRVDLEFKDGAVKLVNYELIPVNYQGANGPILMTRILEDQKVLDVLEPFKTQGEETTAEVVGILKGKFEGHRSQIRVKETNLGNFVTYLMAKSTGSDIAITDSGVIRNSIESGEVTYGKILSVHPSAFSLKYVTLDLTGEELLAYLSKVAILTDGAYPQFYGIKVVLRAGRLQRVEIRARGESSFSELRPGHTYRLAITDFIANGGDAYPTMSNHRSYTQTSQVDAEVMKSYFKSQGTVDADSEQFTPIGNLQRID